MHWHKDLEEIVDYGLLWYRESFLVLLEVIKEFFYAAYACLSFDGIANDRIWKISVLKLDFSLLRTISGKIAWSLFDLTEEKGEERGNVEWKEGQKKLKEKRKEEGRVEERKR